MIRYCLGFMFDQGFDFVLLIKKARPSWQLGRLNGIGGHLKPGETAIEAMVREFREEAGLSTRAEQWQQKLRFCGRDVDGREWQVTTFVTTGPVHLARPQNRDEPLFVVNRRALPRNCITNLHWIVPLLADQDVKGAEMSETEGLIPYEERVSR